MTKPRRGVVDAPRVVGRTADEVAARGQVRSRAKVLRVADDGTLLVVGAAPDVRADLERTLPAYGDVLWVADVDEAVATARSLVPDVVVAPLDAPGLGVLLDALAARNHTRGTAVLVWAPRESLAADIALSAAIDDVVTTPFVPAELGRRIAAQLRLCRLRRQVSTHHARYAQLYEQAPIAIGVLRGRSLVVESMNSRARELVGGRDFAGVCLRDALSGHPGLANIVGPIESVSRTGEPFAAHGVAAEIEMASGGGEREARYFDVAVHALRDAHERVEGVLWLAVDVTESVQVRQGLTREVRERARLQARASLLAEASRRLLEARDVEEAFEHLVCVTVPTFARRAEVVVAQGAELVGLARHDAAPASADADVADAADVRLAAASGETVVSRSGGGVELFDPTIDAASAAPIRRMALPVEVAGFTLGALRFVRGDDEPPYVAEDVRFGEELARRTAIVVETARLQRIERETRWRVERLQAFTAALSETATVEDAASVTLREASVQLGAEAAVVYALSEDGTRLTAVVRGGPQAEWFPVEVDARERTVVGSGLAERTGTYFERLDPHARWSPPFAACASLPLVRPGGGTFGVVCVAFARARCFPLDERTFLEAVARQAAVALERARLLDDERRARNVAEETARVRDEFLATVSHELRTPLTAIVGWTSVLRDGERDDGSLDRALEVIDRNSKALTRIVEDILDVSRIITGNLRLEPEPFALEDVLREAVDTVRHAARAKRLQLVLLQSEAPSRLVGDPARLRQVFWNLLSNAVRYTPAGGSIRASLSRLDDEIVVEVRDTGVGIEPAFLPHVWERFRQADGSTTRRHGGLGLGLSIVRHVVELHGGWVEAASDGPGKGAAFRVHLYERAHVPTDTPSSRRHSDVVAVARPAARLLGDLAVLVVEDEGDTRELLRSVLEGAGARVVVAGSAPEAMDRLEERLPDLVVCDIGLPDVDGYAFLARARATHAAMRAVPVVALTAFARREDAVRAREAGFLAHIAKPLQSAALVERLAALLGRSRDSVPMSVARPA